MDVAHKQSICGTEAPGSGQVVLAEASKCLSVESQPVAPLPILDFANHPLMTPGLPLVRLFSIASVAADSLTLPVLWVGA